MGLNQNSTERPGFTETDASTFMNEREVKVKHAGPGIASFVLGLLSILAFAAFFLMFSSTLYQYANTYATTGLDPEELASNPGFIGSLVLFAIYVLFAFAGVILGIVGCSMRHRRKVFAVTGLIINVIMLLLVVGLIIFGVIAQQVSL
ncbi:hypothetical protein Q5741_19000 [Paenibacillus sp. JX-17]|uniref:DUF4064 domain-containing protein n=1 Tax=Paenibacillus lacisoli TaxID=3064525 RepID=A0ABT9CGU9_9BACL|nr:hypothetical protein [Paenibacillus sp. JX-17]MDO7908492.1 hypothetical protein [Paenibacillus sp. JX-17]